MNSRRQAALREQRPTAERWKRANPVNWRPWAELSALKVRIFLILVMAGRGRKQGALIRKVPGRGERSLPDSSLIHAVLVVDRQHVGRDWVHLRLRLLVADVGTRSSLA